MLASLLARLPPEGRFANLLLGVATNDDAAVYRISDDQAVVATTDFVTPIVDDPFDFGRIAAANALSDVYAVGGRPILAIAIAGMPVARIPAEMIARIFEGGAAICADAGVPVAGGHTIDAAEPFYGLAAIGLVDPGAVKRNADGRPGDCLILGKGLGIGVLGAAANEEALDGEGYAELIASATQLNAIGVTLASHSAIHAVTDVTGNGLCGHLLEICRASHLAAAIAWDALPLLPSAARYGQTGFNTGAAGRNWQSYMAQVTVPEAMPAWQRNLLMDPQTSGGLLVSVDPAAAGEILETFHEAGYQHAAVIGTLLDGDPAIRVT